MKKKIIHMIGICSVLIFGSATTMIPSGSSLVQKKDPVVILSIPDWALGKYLIDEPQIACSHPNNLKALRVFDNTLYKTLIDYHPVGNYVLTKKYNPCCPCNGSTQTCCKCQQSMMFASPSNMDTSVKIGSNGPNAQKVTKQGLDFFTIPSNVQADTLVIDGKGIVAPLKFAMN